MSELDEIRAILRDVAVQQQEFRAGMNELRTSQEQSQRLIDANTTAIASLGAEMREGFVAVRTELRTEVESVVQMIIALSETVREQAEQTDRSISNLRETIRQQSEQAERDRAQAAIDRAEFRTTVEGILNALTERFSGNGH
jgi:alkyl sulfatase BDS1-like metallo-beta-lactamase superfamily hydrolase